jgi:hypothetical protein
MKRRNLEATTQAVGVAVDGSTEQNSRAWQSVLIQATLRMPSAQLRRSHSERKTTENPVSIDEFVSAACRTSDVEAVHVTKFQEKKHHQFRNRSRRSMSHFKLSSGISTSQRF